MPSLIQGIEAKKLAILLALFFTILVPIAHVHSYCLSRTRGAVKARGLELAKVALW